MNLKIKFRESFRPFAPAVLEEHCAEYFELKEKSPYMLLTANVRKELRFSTANEEDMLRRVNECRSAIPAVTHLDYSARVQTVSEEENPTFYQIIKAFWKKTGCACLVNTSFNVRGEPIVCTPMDAYRCFMRTDMDALVLGHFLLYKKQQPVWKEREDWKRQYVLD